MNIHEFLAVDDVDPADMLPYPQLLQYKLPSDESLVIECEAKLFFIKWTIHTPSHQAILAERILSLVPETGNRAVIDEVYDEDADSLVMEGVRIANVTPSGCETYRILIQKTRP